MKAVVTSVAPNEITVDIGTKHTGYVPLAELTSDPSLKPEEHRERGDKIELVVLRVNDVKGTVMLSKKRLDAQAGFEKVMAAAGTGEVLSGTVTDVVKGGVLAITEGVKVFIPASLSGVSKTNHSSSCSNRRLTLSHPRSKRETSQSSWLHQRRSQRAEESSGRKILGRS